MKELLKFLNKKCSVFILTYILIKDNIAMAGDLEAFLEIKIDNSIGNGLLPADIVKNNKRIENIRFEETGLFVNGEKYALSDNPYEDYPFICDPDNRLDFVQGIEITKEIKGLVEFCSKDVLRPAILGVYFDKNKLIATNGQMLKWVKTDYTGPNIIVPAKCFKLLPEGTYYIYVSSNKYRPEWISFQNQTKKYWFRLIDNEYPNYKVVIPEDNPNSISVNRVDMINALDAVINKVYFDSKKYSKCVISFLKDSINIYANNIDFERECSKDVKATVKSSEPKIAFDLMYLITCLKSLETENVEIKFSTSTRSVIINNTILLMPIRLDY